MISLPRHKMLAWINDIDCYIRAKLFKHHPFESLVGKLTHVTTIIPLSKCFLSQFYPLLNISSKRGTCHLSELACSDLAFWKFLLRKAHAGLSLNLLSMRVPTHLYKADASSVGIGGYSLSGRAWRWQLPPHLLGRASINLLEFLASLVGPWIDIIEGNLPEYSSCLCEGDNRSAICWLTNANFSSDEQPAHHAAARRIATLLMNNNSNLHPQWISGSTNVVADCLSRDFDCTDILLTTILLHLFPSQMPQAFEIAPLPR